jgi:hypothetical protein
MLKFVKNGASRLLELSIFVMAAIYVQMTHDTHTKVTVEKNQKKICKSKIFKN